MSTSGTVGRHQRVVQILDDSIGGPDATFAFHGPFWRGLSRDQLVAMDVFGLPLVELGHGAASNLVLALKGESPFGADLPEPPPDSQFSRMPAGLPAVADADIAFVEAWIDDGCPADDDDPPAPSWRPTNAPEASARTDDIWFRSEALGWAVNSNGQILRTSDGGATWDEQLHDPKVYLRCIGFASDQRGWAGTLSSTKRLYATDDGGATWAVVLGLPALAPSAVCGLSVVDASVVYASGTNHPNRPARMMKTVDGGRTWTAWEMGEHAALLVDTCFTSRDHGWVVGGVSDKAKPTRADVRAVVLETSDGGQTWVDRVADLRDELPLGEWGWKTQWVDDRLGFVALESFERAAVLKTTDGGRSWARIEVRDQQGNVNLEGVGFLDEQQGWVGGWGSADFTAGSTSATVDGGTTWTDANDVGRFLNRFRFLGRPVTVGYASGRTVYKYSDEPVPAPARAAALAPALLPAGPGPLRTGRPLRLEVTVPASSTRLTVDLWDRFGELARQLVDQPDPPPGPRTVEWDGTDAGHPVEATSFLVRATVDGRSESQVVELTPPS